MKSIGLHKILAVCGCFIFMLNVSAEETKIYQQDSTGNIQYHKPSVVINKNGRIIETDAIGNKQYHKQQYQIKDGKIYQTDSLGNIQYHKPQGVIKAVGS
ncbi:MAG: hypothetical protein V4570_00020 [Pseudomonadota bacterium]